MVQRSEDGVDSIPSSTIDLLSDMTNPTSHTMALKASQNCWYMLAPIPNESFQQLDIEKLPQEEINGFQAQKIWSPKLNVEVAGCQLHFEWQGGETQVRDEKGRLSLADTLGMVETLPLTGLLTTKSTLPETNITLENKPSQKEIHLPTIDVQGLSWF